MPWRWCLLLLALSAAVSAQEGKQNEAEVCTVVSVFPGRLLQAFRIPRGGTVACNSGERGNSFGADDVLANCPKLDLSQSRTLNFHAVAPWALSAGAQESTRTANDSCNSVVCTRGH